MKNGIIAPDLYLRVRPGARVNCLNFLPHEVLATHTGYSISFVPRSRQGTQKLQKQNDSEVQARSEAMSQTKLIKRDSEEAILPTTKTLTELLRERGIKDAPPDDPIYREKFSIGLRGPSQPHTQKLPNRSDNEGQAQPQQKLIDKHSKGPADRSN